MKNFLFALLVLMLILPLDVVKANPPLDEPSPDLPRVGGGTTAVEMIPGTRGLSAPFVQGVAAILSANNPDPKARYYQITSSDYDGKTKKFTLSVMGFEDKADPSLSTARVMARVVAGWESGYVVGVVQPVNMTPVIPYDQAVKASKAAEATDTVASSYVFPWEPGHYMRFGGDDAIDEAGFPGVLTEDDWYAIDFFTDEVGEHAPATAYAANGGTVDYVCYNTANMAIFMGGFLYDHLEPNDAIVAGSSYYRQGDAIGGLVFGDIETPEAEPDCGEAEQLETWAHLHFAFRGEVEMDGCKLSLIDIQFSCPQRGFGYGHLDWILATGTGQEPGIDPLPDPGERMLSNFWDILVGLTSWFVDNVAMRFFPDAQSLNMARYVTDFAQFMIQIFYYTAIGFNLTFPLAVISLMATIEVLTLAISVSSWIGRLIKFVIPLLPFL